MSFPLNACLAALSAMADRPKNFIKRVTTEADEYGELPITTVELLDYLVAASPNDPLLVGLGVNLAVWDAVDGAPWTEGTARASDARRALIYGLLRFEAQ